MKNLVSGSSILLVTAGLLALSFGCGEGSEETGYTAPEQSASINGECNAILGTALGAAQQCSESACACDEIGSAAEEFFGEPPFFDGPCTAAFAAGELDGLPGSAAIQPAGPNAGVGKHVGNVICSSVITCGLCANIPPGTCADC